MTQETSFMSNQIIHGDCREVMKSIPSNSIDLVITSPPYFVNKEYEDIRKDKNILDEWNRYIYDLLLPTFYECNRLLKEGGHLWINIDDSHTSIKSELKKNIVLPTHAILIAELSKLYDYKELVLWRKIRGKHASGGSNRLLGSYGRFGSPGSIPIVQEVEYVLWFKKQGQRKDITDDRRKESKLTNEEFKQYGMQIWDINPERSRKIGHPAPFPIDIPNRCIKLGSFVHDLVLDPFAGSGTTAIASIQNHRNYICIEKDWNYFSLMENRIKDFNSQTTLDRNCLT